MKGHVLRLLTMAWMVLMATALPTTAQVSLVSTGSVWSYLDNGSDQGTAWRAPGFDDSTWANGFAPLGYGDAWIVTTNDFGPDANNKYVTTYYRAIFNVANASALTNLLLRIRRDDGPVVYLNGTEVYRNNLPTGAIAYNTYALAAIGDADELALVPTNPAPSLLVNGANVIAVEMHQNTTNSSDLSFDLELLGNFLPVPPVASITSPASGAVLATANVTLVASAADQDGAVTKVEFYQAGSKVGEDTTAPYSFTVVGLAAGTYTFSVRAFDSNGLNTDSDDVLVQVTAPPPTLVSLGATWKYLVTATAADPGWTNVNFNDTSWATGPGKLGYGDGDEATTIGYGPDAANKYPTAYFRHKFNVGNPSLYSSLTMTLVYDDGAVVYLNGAEVNRVNLPAAPATISYATFALGAADYTPNVIPLPTSALLAGENIITVEMHQGNAGSSDLAMDLQIQGVLPPSVIITSPNNGASFTVPVNFTINAEATDADGTVTRVEFYDGLFPLGSDTTPPYAFNVTALTEGSHSLTAVVTDNSGATATSEAVVINVTDPNPPVLLSASATSNKVTVVFSKRVVPPSATTPGNYTISGGVSVQSVEYGTTSNRVVLTTSTMVNGASYTLTVNNVRDALNNVISPNSQVAFTVLGFAATDVGLPVVQGSSTIASGGFDVAGAGTDIGGTTDQFHFNYESDQRVGDFDVKVRLAGFVGTDPFAKAGLMARESLAGNSRYAASIATPSVAGCFFQQRSAVGGATVNGGYVPTTYPNTWLRLRRVGNVFTGYASADGSAWVILDSATILLPSNLFVGMAVSSRNASQLATAQFRDFGVNTGGTVGSLVLSQEPLGPSSRKTGLVISEIMYHPRNVPGAPNSLEFIEIFNSQSFFENIGGYRLSGSIEYTFAPGTVIPAGGFIVVARDPAFIQGHYGITGVLGPWVGASTNGLPGSGGRVRLRNPAGAVLLEVNYDSEDPWPISADGAGHSLVLARASYGENDPRAWAASDAIDGSPGKADPYASDRLSPVVINEFLAHTDPPLDDYIELYNHSNQAIDLSGAYLTDESDTNKFRIPNGTSIPARGFYVVTVNPTATGFALSSGGERVYLVNSNQTRVIDAVDFGPQENGVSTGRFPDGAAAFYRMATRTPGAANGATRNDSIVINEIMFSPISGDDDDEYIELYNRSASPVNLADWSLVDGVDYTFPPNTIIPAGGYKVVARNMARMLANYPNLNVGNTVGNFDGSLGNGGERIALAMPEYNVTTNNGVLITNIVYIVVNEVTYGDGGKWGYWADGGGSSLELKDPRSDNRHAANWADSDESDKGLWTTIEVTGNIGETLGSPINDSLQIFLLGIGECLLDEVEVRNSGGANLIGSNYSFENGLTGWTPQGSHDHSTIENVGFVSARSLHLRAGSRGDNGGNRLRSPAFSGVAATNVTLRARAKWIRGWPELLLRLHGGGLEVGGRLAIAPNLGTPGAVNSKAVANAGPAIYDVVHSPILPATSEAVVVTARATDPNTPFSLVLKYRVDPATSYTDVTMVDTGSAGDAIANDGIYSATIPGQSTGGTVAFYIQGTDSSGGVNTFPQDLFPVAGLNRVFPLDAHTREAIIRWGDRQMPGSFGTYRLWLSATNTARWTTRLPKLNNTPLDGTFVYNNYRVIYNMMPQYAGSPWHRGQMTTGPAGTQRCDYDIEFPVDDRLLGATDFVWNNPGNPDGVNTSDTSAQSEQTSYQIFKEIGVHYNYRRYVHVFVNGVQRSTTGNRPGNFIFEDSQQPNGDVIDEWFPDDPDGDLYKIEDWFEFPDNGDDFTTNNDADLLRRTTVLNGFPSFHTAAYRFMWRLRSRGVGQSANDYSSFYDMLNVVSPTANNAAPIDVGAIEDLIDYEQWMRVFACQHAVGNWDAYGHDRGKNAYTYKGQNGKFHQWTWDIDFTMGIGGDSATTANLFDCTDDRVRAMWQAPAIRRAYWRAYEDIVNGPLNNAFMDPILDAKAAALAANNVNYDPGAVTTIKNYIRDRRNFLLTQMGNLPNVAFTVNGPTAFSTNGNIATLSGTAAIGVKDIYINGVLYPVTWTSETAWLVRIPLGAGANQIVLQGYDNKGRPVAGTSRTNTVTNTGPAVPPPQGFVVINEIMFNPLVPEAEFVELFNTSTTSTFDLSGLEFNGIDYVFPPASYIVPRGYLVLTKSRSAFNSAYGSTIPVFDQYDGNLQADGETISLIRRGATPAQDEVIDKVRYEPGRPWPVGPEGVNTASSVQLIDSAQDNSRPLNWNTFYVPPVYAPGTNFPGATNSGWRYVTYTGRIQGPPSTPGTNFLIFLNSPGGEVFIDDMSLVVGTVAESGPNLIQNGDFESPFAPAWSALGNHAGSAISNLRSRSGASSLRVFATGGGTANNFVRQFIPTPAGADLQYTLSYWFYSTTNTTILNARTQPGNSMNNVTNVQIEVIPPFSLPPRLVVPGVATVTPGSNNTATAALATIPPIWLNEVQAFNTAGIADNFGEREPWVELFNAGASPIDLSSLYLTDNYDTNLTRWQFPAGASLAPGEFKVVWVDGEPGETSGTNLHTSFRLAAGSGTVALTRLVNGNPEILDYLTYNAVPAGRSYGDFPDGQPFTRFIMRDGTPRGTNSARLVDVFINEWLAANTNTIADPADGQFEDWIELYNAGTNAVDLGGFWITDNPGSQNDYFQIPANGQYVIPAGGFLLIWADNETSQNSPARPDLHVSFALGRGGDNIALYAPDKQALIDRVTFGAQTDDISQGRYPDGANNTNNFVNTTPRTPNQLAGGNTPPTIFPIGPKSAVLGQPFSFTVNAFDSQFSQTLTFTILSGAPAGASIHPTSGLFTWNSGFSMVPSTNNVTVQVTDNGNPPLSDTETFTLIGLPPPPSIGVNGNQISIGFATIPGKTYRVEFKNDLGAAVWQQLNNQDYPSGGATSLLVNDQLNQAQRFYRIVQLD